MTPSAKRLVALWDERIERMKATEQEQMAGGHWSQASVSRVWTDATLIARDEFISYLDDIEREARQEWWDGLDEQMEFAGSVS